MATFSYFHPLMKQMIKNDNHYKHYHEWMRIRIDMNCRCEFWIFFKWTVVFDVSVTVLHEIASILLEIVLTVALYLSMGTTQKSRWVKRKRFNRSRMFIFYTSVTEKSWLYSIRCEIQQTINWYRKYVHVHVWGHSCKKIILTFFISVLKLIQQFIS